MQQCLSLHGRDGTADSKCNGNGIRVITHCSHKMPHHLAGELVPLDTGSITQHGREPSKKETHMLASFGGIAEGISILSRVVQFFLEGFRYGGKEFHDDVILLSSSLVLLHLFDPS